MLVSALGAEHRERMPAGLWWAVRVFRKVVSTSEGVRELARAGFEPGSHAHLGNGEIVSLQG